MKSLLTVMVAMFIMAPATNPGEWSLKKRKDQIEIYTRDSGNNGLKEFKATTVFETSFETLLEELYYAPTYEKSCNFNTSYRIHKDDLTDGYYFYYKEKLPWPLKDRDVVTRLYVIKQTPKEVFLGIEAVPGVLPKEDQTIRITDLKGSWHLVQQEDGGIKATQQIYMDPAGKVPTFIVNSLIVKGPLKTFTSLKRALQQ